MLFPAVIVLHIFYLPQLQIDINESSFRKLSLELADVVLTGRYGFRYGSGLVGNAHTKLMRIWCRTDLDLTFGGGDYMMTQR